MRQSRGFVRALIRWPYALAAAFLFILIVGISPPASAQVACNVNGPALSFGTINPNSGFPYTTSGNFSVACTNSSQSAVTVTACVSIGTGSGGTTPTNRTLASGADKIPIQITGGTSHTGQIGNGTSYTMDGPFALNVGAFQTVPATIPLVVTMPQPGAPPNGGSYTSNFSGNDALFYYTFTSAPTSCTAAAFPAATQANFSVNATVPSQCTVATTSLAFPTGSVLKATVDASSTITVTCSTSIPVTVALDNGATGTSPIARKMKSGVNAITYGIYLNAARTAPWGNTAGTNTASLSGSGSLTAYGRVPVQPSPPPGAYSDVVNVTISY